MATVLVVDDSATIRGFVRRALEGDGHEVLEAGSAFSATHHAKQRPIDLMIIDLNLPGTDGITLTGRLRKLEGCATVPILIFSAEDSKQQVNAGREAGATGWLKKPTTRNDFLRICRKLLGSKPQPGEQGEPAKDAAVESG